MQNQNALCSLCGEPMPKGEEMFKYHGFSGSCPKPLLSPEPKPTYENLIQQLTEANAKIAELEKELNCLPTGIDKEVFEDVCYERDDLFQKFSRAVEGLKEAHNTMSKIEKFGLGVNIEKNLVITNTADLLTSALDKIKQIRGEK